MKRWLVRICVFLLLGAIVNVAVAWGCGLFSIPDGQMYLQHDTIAVETIWEPIDLRRRPLHGSGTVHRVIHLHDERVPESTTNWTTCIVIMFKGFGIRTVELKSSHAGVPTDRQPWISDSINWLDGLRWTARFEKGRMGTISAQGWPQPALWYGEFDLLGLQGAWHISDEELPGYLYFDHALAYRPLCPGFAINTVFYALVLWLLFAAPFALRRRRRIKRGLCPKCAYDLRGSDATVCPECGATVIVE